MKFEVEGYVTLRICLDIDADGFDDAQNKAEKHLRSTFNILPDVEGVGKVELYAFVLPEDE